MKKVISYLCVALVALMWGMCCQTLAAIPTIEAFPRDTRANVAPPMVGYDGSSAYNRVIVKSNGSVTSDVLPATLAQTATAAAGSSATATLAAPGAGLFHYITRIQVTKFAAAALTAAATPVLVTTTNISNTPTFSMQADAAAQGTEQVFDMEFNHPIKSSVANTATTVVGPATTNVIWRINVFYYTGP